MLLDVCYLLFNLQVLSTETWGTKMTDNPPFGHLGNTVGHANKI